MNSHVTIPKSFIRKFYSLDKQLYRLNIDNEVVERITANQDDIFTINDYFSYENEQRISLQVERVFGNLRALLNKGNLEHKERRSETVFKLIDRALCLQFARIEGFLKGVLQKSLIFQITNASENDVMEHVLNGNYGFDTIFPGSRKGIITNDTDIPFVLGKDVYSNILINNKTGFIMPFSPTFAFVIFEKENVLVKDNRTIIEIENDLKNGITQEIAIHHQTNRDLIKYINFQILLSEIVTSRNKNDRFIIGEKNSLILLKQELPKAKIVENK